MNYAALLQDLGSLHFLRPGWLGALLLLPLLAWWWKKRQRQQSAWRGLVDPHLLPHLLDVRGDRRSRHGIWLAAAGYLLAVLALAGPSWRQSAQPLWQSRTPVVVALDLSSASLAADMPPSRLAQARAKLATLLRERTGGPIALVAFAGDAFTVAPLTDDAANVALFLDALQPDVMPRDGQRPGDAIAWSAQLLQRAGATRGDIIVLTDHADAAAIAAAADAAGMGYRVSALGLGSEAGAAYRRSAGEIANARLDAASLRRLAASGNGRYVALAGDDVDLRALGLLDPGRTGAAGRGTAGLAWRDEGYWLLPPLMLVALLAFRRRGGGALAVLVLSFALPPGKAQATDLWRRPDQAEYARMQRGNQSYHSGDYPSAARQYQGIDTATAHYNRGNALAKAGQYPQAIEAYDRALREQPGMADAIANRRAVEAAMKRQQQSGSQQGEQSQSGQSQGGQGQGQSNQPSSAQPDAASKAGSQAQQQPSPRQQQGTPQQDKPEQAQDKPEHAQPSAASPQDAQAQQQADRAQRERMQRALQQAREHDGKQASQARVRVEETPEQRERRLANEAWLKRVPDDPGGLLRAKFRLEYERRVAQGRATP
ncbi:Ca-activated chloride channel family protein [Lysobacter niabensis]|uniref:Ca-activated chloride channel family protein n=1 Tax=Agrilutibacter niabensis TaxID=380628 RepID=A0ABU1VRL1_9GAMM|nr:VWA domain-containing protein [Lysobacter niabensis]MDR7099733.1 Ca-activated chloride channel family protein [Lysobacter niabensis]